MLKFMMGVGLYEDNIKVLFIWTLGSVTRVIQQIWKLKKNICFVSVHHLD